jgi:hypothetical protein
VLLTHFSRVLLEEEAELFLEGESWVHFESESLEQWDEFLEFEVTFLLILIVLNEPVR